MEDSDALAMMDSLETERSVSMLTSAPLDLTLATPLLRPVSIFLEISDAIALLDSFLLMDNVLKTTNVMLTLAMPTCRRGTRLNNFNDFKGDGVTCEDVNECFRKTDNCDVNAKCTNTVSLFSVPSFDVSLGWWIRMQLPTRFLR